MEAISRVSRTFELRHGNAKYYESSEDLVLRKVPGNRFVKSVVLEAKGKLTLAPSIKRVRAKLQEQYPEFRGEKYNLRKGKIQEQWRKDLGYEVYK